MSDTAQLLHSSPANSKAFHKILPATNQRGICLSLNHRRLPHYEGGECRLYDGSEGHRAKASVIRKHGTEGTTPKRIAARIEMLRLEQMERDHRLAEQLPPPVPGLADVRTDPVFHELKLSVKKA